MPLTEEGVMKLGDLDSGKKFRVVGWENGPVLVKRYCANFRARISVMEPDGDFRELKTGVIADSGSMNIPEILRTTHVLPASTEVELVRE